MPKEQMVVTPAASVPSLAQGVAREVLKNTFRDEVKDPLAGISAQELLERDQLIMLAQYETKQKLINMDLLHLARLEKLVVELRTFVSQQPVSQGRNGALGDIENQLESLKKQRAATFFSRPDEVMMLSLQKVLGKAHVVAHQGQALNTIEDRQVEQKLEPVPEPETLLEVEDEGENTMQNDHLDPNESLEDGEASSSSTSKKVPGETHDDFKPMKGDGLIKTEGGGDPDKDFDNEDTV